MISKYVEKKKLVQPSIQKFMLKKKYNNICMYFRFPNTEWMGEKMNEWNGNRLYRQDAKTVKFMDGWLYSSLEMGTAARTKKARRNTLSTIFVVRLLLGDKKCTPPECCNQFGCWIWNFLSWTIGYSKMAKIRFCF